MPTILLVEDSEENRMVFEAFLMGIHCQLEIAKDGLEAVNKCKKYKFELIFMDLQMPVMDGIEATRLIRAWEEENRTGNPTPIVALTAHSSGEEVDKCLQAGCNHVLAKPVPRHLLMRTLHFWMGQP
ncbi:MAG: response regulator [Magnetococcales bacterium]|nr:response regulator [Magnetococcales bacterium]